MELCIGTSGGREFCINAQELVTGRTCIIAQSGAGKSWSIAVLCENLCKSQIGFCLIDTEGEYFSLKDEFNIIWVGADENCDEDIEKVNIKQLMHRAVEENIPVIFDVSEVDMHPRVTKLAHVLYDVATELKKPYLLIVEEADKFIPQSKDSIKKIEEISRRGRKRGLGMLVATQRPAIVTKNVLSQCNNQIIGKLSIENDLKSVGLFFSSKHEVEELTTLNPGDFFVMGNLTHEKTRMRFGKRVTKHRGLTPQLDPRPVQPEPEVEEEEKEPATPKTADPVTPPAEKPKPKTRRPKTQKEAILPIIDREDALAGAQKKMKKKVFTFGVDERLISGVLIYWPLIYLEVRHISGRIRKNTAITSFILNGDGHSVNITNGLRLRPCFSEFIGLDEDTLRVIIGIPHSGATEAELEVITHLPTISVRKAVESLQKRKLITATENVGETEVYVPLLANRIPKLKQGSNMENIDNLRIEPLKGGHTRPNKLQKDEIRTILKVIEPTAEITNYHEFHYPVYEITLGTDVSERTLFIDGVTGKEIYLG